MAIFNIIEEQEYDELDYMLDMCNEMVELVDESRREDRELDKSIEAKKRSNAAAKELEKNGVDSSVADRLRKDLTNGERYRQEHKNDVKNTFNRGYYNKYYADSRLYRHEDYGTDKLAQKKPGAYLKAQEAKKKAIKETCLYILSVLDEM